MCQEEDQIDQAEVDAADEEDDARAALTALLLRLSLPTGNAGGGDEAKDTSRGTSGRDDPKTPDRTGRDTSRSTGQSGQADGRTSSRQPEPKPEPEPAPAPKKEEKKKLPPENYSKMKPAQLAEACRKRGLSDKGKKNEFIKRLQAYDKS